MCRTMKSPTRTQWTQNHRERLASVAAGRQAGWYGLLAQGKALITSHNEELDDFEIQRLYASFEARLAAAMTNKMGTAALHLNAVVASMFLQISTKNQTGLIADLEGVPFV